MTESNNRWVKLYPLVHKFFRGYLHQDFPEVYGSMPGAIRVFRDDVGPTEYANFAEQWSKLLHEIHDWPVSEIGHVVSADLGASWNVTSRQELQSFSEIVNSYAK